MASLSQIISSFEQKQIQEISSLEKRTIADFAPGDTIKVDLKIIESSGFRIQSFIGVCIGRKNAGLRSAFKVRKVSENISVVRHFQLYSPSISSISIVRKGDVRRAKLYYLTKLRGKAARIKEKMIKVSS